MKKSFLLILILNLIAFASAVSGLSAAEVSGEALFKKHCANCHIHADQLRSQTDLDVVDSLRNPPPAMPKFETYKISDIEAQAIASYIQFQIISKLEHTTR